MKIRPEVKDVKYWIHLVIIAVIAVAIIQYVNNPNIVAWLDLQSVIIVAFAVGVADIIAHTILKLD